MEAYLDSVLSGCASLKLAGIKYTVTDVMELAVREKWPYERFLSALFEKELEHRDQARKKSLIRKAGFIHLQYLEDLDRSELPEDMAVALPELETLGFIREGRNIIMYGNPGTGKTHCAIGLGIKAAIAGYNVMYTSVPHLLTQIKECESLKKLGSLQKRFEEYDLVICDEFGYKSFDKEGAESLFNHISLRAGFKSTIVTTNLGFDKWDQIFTDKVIASAIVDRLTFKSYIINMAGKSFRIKATEQWMKNKTKKK